MKPLLLSIAATAALVAAFPTAVTAAPWYSINQRQAIMEEHINQGIRRGTLTRAEAIALRGEFNMIANLEAEYRRTGGGLSDRERADLDHRFDGLSRRIQIQKSDDQNRGEGRWTSLSEQKARIHARIDDGVRRGKITRPEAIKLRGEFNTLLALEAEFRRSGGGLSRNEREDLERRLDRLSRDISAERRDYHRY